MVESLTSCIIMLRAFWYLWNHMENLWHISKIILLTSDQYQTSKLLDFLVPMPLYHVFNMIAADSCFMKEKKSVTHWWLLCRNSWISWSFVCLFGLSCWIHSEPHQLSNWNSGHRITSFQNSWDKNESLPSQLR